MTQPTTTPVMRRPLGLLVAAVVVALQGLALIGVAFWMLYEEQVETDFNRNVATGAMVALFVYGSVMLLLAYGLWRRKGWCYGATFFWQLIALGFAYTAAQGGHWLAALPLGISGLAGIVALLRGDTRVALGRG